MLKKILNFLTDRINIMRFLYFLMCVIFVLRLVSLQIINGADYDRIGKNQTYSTQAVEAARGSILDTNGVPIATVDETYKLQFLKTGLKSDELNTMFLKLYKLLKRRKSDINRSLSTYFTIAPYKFDRMLRDIEKPEDLMKRVNLHLVLEFKEYDKITPKAIFLKLREKYGIPESYTLKQAYAVMCLRYETWNATQVKSVEIATDVTPRAVAEITDLQHYFPGVSVGKSYVRKYNNAESISHVLGYYRANDSLGVENSMDNYLKGTPGETQIEINENGQIVETFDHKPAEPGDNVVLTIDTDLQKVAEKSLERTISRIRNGYISGSGNYHDCDAGAVVAMNVNTGAVLAMASYPDYNPNVFLKSDNSRKAQKKIKQYYKDSSKSPMLNRAISAMYPPGSTYKPIVGIAGLESGTITPYTSFYDPVVLWFNNRKFFCLEGGHGQINLLEGLETSCNVYFYLLGVKTGINTIDKYAEMFGLGEYSGIDLPGEVKGERSNRDSKEIHLSSEGPWCEANTAMSSIGQYLNRFTPLQMCRLAAALATGRLIEPYVVEKAVKNNGKVTYKAAAKSEKLNVKASTLSTIRQGMIASVNGARGTSGKVFGTFKYRDSITVAGKTGTAQLDIRGRSDNAAYMCYAPANDPEIAIYVYLEKGVWGVNGAYVAKDILEKYFDIKNKKNQNNPVKQSPEGPSLR